MKDKGKKAWEEEELRKDGDLISRWVWKGHRVAGREEALGRGSNGGQAVHSLGRHQVTAYPSAILGSGTKPSFFACDLYITEAGDRVVTKLDIWHFRRG